MRIGYEVGAAGASWAIASLRQSSAGRAALKTEGYENCSTASGACFSPRLRGSDPVAGRVPSQNVPSAQRQRPGNTNHQWYLNKMSPEEKAARDTQRNEFQKRYSN
jgi:hypothetical protein